MPLHKKGVAVQVGLALRHHSGRRTAHDYAQLPVALGTLPSRHQTLTQDLLAGRL